MIEGDDVSVKTHQASYLFPAGVWLSLAGLAFYALCPSPSLGWYVIKVFGGLFLAVVGGILLLLSLVLPIVRRENEEIRTLRSSEKFK